MVIKTVFKNSIMTIEKGKYLFIAERSKISSSVTLWKLEKELFEFRHGKLLRYIDFTVLNLRIINFKY